MRSQSPALRHFEFLKQEARRLKKAAGIPHFEALEQVARKHGFHHWNQLKQSLNTPSGKVEGVTRPDTVSPVNLTCQYDLDHYRNPKCSDPIMKLNPPAIAFTRLVDELYPAIYQAMTHNVNPPQAHLYRADYMIIAGVRKNQAPVVDFVGCKIDTKKLLRMSLQTTHAGKEELKALACQSGVAWKEIDHTKEEKSRIQLQRNFRIAVMRFPVSEPVNQAAVMALVHCALKHISQIDESGLDSSHILKRAWFHSV